LTVPVDAHDLSEVVRFYYECIEVLGFLTTHPQIYEAVQNFSPEDKEQLTALINQMAFEE
ncbi:hypothetical protein, partial [Limosilactobacillus reuteri]|uniref:hypothetical protein n=1 Tax=Limosilactobacillus reuteri TaxID=1598 RepID=UPI00207CDC8E